MKTSAVFPDPLKLLRYYRIFRRFKESTMVERTAFIANLHLAAAFLARPRLKGGCVVECGTWRGGMAAGLMTVGGSTRTYHFFDSFQGLPPPGVEDGEEAHIWRRNTGGPRYFNNCTATRDEFMKVIALAAVPEDRVHVHEGFFDQTFRNADIPPIAVLRLDVDWYASTLLCFERFWDALLPGALVLIDDYYDWEGCRKAVHCFLARRDAREAICQTPFGGVCYFVKM